MEESQICYFSGLTSHGDFGGRLAGTNVVGGHTFVRPTVGLSDSSYEQLSILRGLGSCRQVRSSHPTPLEPDGIGAMGKALHLQGTSWQELHLVR